MPILHAYEDEDYLPEHGLLVVRDRHEAAVDHPDLAFGSACGSIALAGEGWLQASAGDGPHLVRLESYDGMPVLDEGWDDMLETPYRAHAGGVGLTYVTGGPGGDDLDLGSPGLFRVRVARRRVDDHRDVWRLQFWPVIEPVEPPRWLVRGTPPVPALPGASWPQLLEFHTKDVWEVVHAASYEHGSPVTFEQVDDWARRHSRGPGWLDAPLYERPPAHPYFGKQRDQLRDFAAQLGLPAPVTHRDMLTFFLRTGCLVEEGGRYRNGVARDVFELPAEQAAQLAATDTNSRFGNLAAELAWVVVWCEDHRARTTMAQLSERMLASVDEVRGALEHAVGKQMLSVDGEITDPEVPLTITALPG